MALRLHRPCLTPRAIMCLSCMFAVEQRGPFLRLESRVSGTGYWPNRVGRCAQPVGPRPHHALHSSCGRCVLHWKSHWVGPFVLCLSAQALGVSHDMMRYAGMSLPHTPRCRHLLWNMVYIVHGLKNKGLESLMVLNAVMLEAPQKHTGMHWEALYRFRLRICLFSSLPIYVLH